MKREILFRGKRINDGRWMFGDLMQPNGNKFIDIWEVDNNTVGQFTGKTDNITGRKVFENDILSVHIRGEYYSHVGQVKYADGMFYVELDIGKYTFVDIYEQDADIEVIGNVHDKSKEVQS